MPIGQVRHISDGQLWIAMRGESADVPVPMTAARVDERGGLVLNVKQAGDQARRAVRREAMPWQPSTVPSFVDRIYGRLWSVEEIHDCLEEHVVRLGFGGLAIHDAETLVAHDHPDAPNLVFVVEDLTVCTRIRAYDGTRTRLCFVPAEWEGLARAILVELAGGLEPDDAERLVAERETLARNVRAEREARALEERQRERERQQEEARLQADREAQERRARFRAERMLVRTEVEDDFIGTSLPGSVLPKRVILSALAAWLASQHLERGKVTSKSARKKWSVRILSAPDPDPQWEVEIEFTRDEDEWQARYSSPAHDVEGWRTSEEETRRILDVAGVVEEVYASLEPQDIGLDDA
jgi:hypothetical protein